MVNTTSCRRVGRRGFFVLEFNITAVVFTVAAAVCCQVANQSMSMFKTSQDHQRAAELARLHLDSLENQRVSELLHIDYGPVLVDEQGRVAEDGPYRRTALVETDGAEQATISVRMEVRNRDSGAFEGISATETARFVDLREGFLL